MTRKERLALYRDQRRDDFWTLIAFIEDDIHQHHYDNVPTLDCHDSGMEYDDSDHGHYPHHDFDNDFHGHHSCDGFDDHSSLLGDNDDYDHHHHH